MVISRNLVGRILRYIVSKFVEITGLHVPSDNIPLGILLADWIFQKVLLVNHDCKDLTHFTSTVRMPDKIKLSRTAKLSLAVNGNCYLQGTNGIEMFDGVIFASGCKFISSNHDVKDIRSHVISEPIRIYENCWLGANVVVLPGVQIGSNSIIGAGSVVTKSVPANVVFAGNPARKIKDLQ